LNITFQEIALTMFERTNKTKTMYQKEVATKAKQASIGKY
jgi:hypothetical protein